MNVSDFFKGSELGLWNNLKHCHSYQS